jgi:hypothetical protein
MEFVSSPLHLSILACLFAISFFGGLYVVPLYAIIQSRSEENFLATVTACGNVSDSAFMVVSSLSAAVMLKLGFSIPHIFLVTAGRTIAALFVIKNAVREM